MLFHSIFMKAILSILKPNDRVIISSNIDLTRSKTVTIEGEVFEPKNYPFFDGMTVVDLILMSKGIQKMVI